MTLTATDLLFAADRVLRDAATDYAAEGFDEDEDEIRRREDALRQAARDYAWAASIVDSAVGVVNAHQPRFAGSAEVLDRITSSMESR